MSPEQRKKLDSALEEYANASLHVVQAHERRARARERLYELYEAANVPAGTRDDLLDIPEFLRPGVAHARGCQCPDCRSANNERNTGQ